MTNFSYPPPPPPPPPLTNAVPPPPSNHQPFRGNNSNTRAAGRGRGRGGQRGAFRGAASNGHHNPTFNSNAPVHPTQQNLHSNSYPLPNYPTWTQPSAPPQNTYQAPQTSLPQYTAPFYNSNTPQSHQFPPPSFPPNHAPSYYSGQGMSHTSYPQPQAPVQPPMMGPPIHLGFDNNHFSANGPKPYRHPSDFGLGQKRKRDNGVHTPPSRRSSSQPSEPSPKPQPKAKVHVAPAVPNFGFAGLPGAASLPPKPPPLAKAKTKKKRKRKNNTLGLTPKGDVHEDTDESVDEEAKFAESGNPIEIARDGQTVQLNTPAEIAAWIEQRKKAFPTQAKIAEKKAKVAAEQQARREKNERMKKEVQAKRVEEKTKREAAKVKAEEQGDGDRSIVKAEEEDKPAKRVKRVSENVDNVRDVTPGPQVVKVSTFDSLPEDPIDRIAYFEEQLRLAKEAAARSTASPASVKIKQEESDAPSTGGTLDTELSASDGVKDASPKPEGSTGSEASSVLSDSSSESDAPPEETSSKTHEPLKVPPPKRVDPTKPEKAVCKNFMQHGTCKFGKKCRYSHDRRNKANPTTNQTKASERKSLHATLVEQELKQEAGLGVDVVKFLGDKGFFE